MSWLTGEHLVVAHRGASMRAPENTLEAFELALEEGADGVELDVRALADGTLVIFHDAAIDGVALASMDLDAWSKASRGLGREPCTLGDALDALAGRALLDIELKEPATVEAVAATLEDRGGPLERVLVTSFLDAAVAGMAERLPQVATGLLLGRERPNRLVRTRVSELFPGRRLAACNAQVVAPNVGLLRAGFTRRAHRGRWPVIVWTVNEGRRLAQLLSDARVAGVITDDPSLAVEVRAGRGWTGDA